MFNLNESCCICLYNKEELLNISVSENEDLTYYVKLTMCIPEMCFEGINEERLICKECCTSIDVISRFRDKCLRSKAILIDYIAQQRLLSSLNGKDAENKIEEIFIKTEVEDNYDEEYEETNVYNFLNIIHNDSNTDSVDLTDNRDENIINVNTNFENEHEIDRFNENLDKETINLNFSNKINNANDRSNESTDDSSTQNYSEINNKIGQNSNSINFQTQELFNQFSIIVKPHKCDICQSSFQYRSKLKTHMQTHATEKPYECQICNKRITDYYSHMRFHRGDRPYECNVCQKKFTRAYHVTQHMLTHTREKAFECQICNGKFARASNLKRHMLKHNKTNWKLNSENNLEGTLNEDNGNTGMTIVKEEVQLDSYPLEGTSTSQMPFDIIEISKIPEAVVLKPKKKIYECPVCKKTIVRKSHLKIHMRIHTGEKPYTCAICNKKFIRNSHLKIHMRTHTGEKPHRCTICDHKFSDPSYLLSHMRIHLGEKSYSCPVCKKKFAQKRNLNKHMVVHKQEKHIECTLCNKKFSRPACLNIHMRLHTGEKPFQCNICHQKFTQHSGLSYHMQKHV